MDKPETYHYSDPGNSNLLRTVEHYRKEYENIYEFYDQFSKIITGTTVNILKNGWKITINHRDGLQMKVSTSVLKKLNIVELFVLASKIPWLKSNENEYFRDKLWRMMMDVSPQAFMYPFMIKLVAGGRLQNITMSDQHIRTIRYLQLTFLESQLRSKRAKLTAPGVKRSEADVKAAEVLYAYRLNDKMIRDTEKDMRAIRREYHEMVFINGEAEINLLKDNEPIISIDSEGELVFRINKCRIRIKDFRTSESSSIQQALTDVKLSTCKDDKVALIPIIKILDEVMEEESINDTRRVRGHPKRDNSLRNA